MTPVSDPITHAEMVAVTKECQKALFVDKNIKKLSEFLTSDFKLEIPTVGVLDNKVSHKKDINKFRELFASVSKRESSDFPTFDKEETLKAIQDILPQVIDFKKTIWNCSLSFEQPGFTGWSLLSNLKVKSDDKEEVYYAIFQALVTFERSDEKVKIALCEMYNFSYVQDFADSESLTQSIFDWLPFGGS